MDERRKERVSMAREICLHRGENPDAVDRRGNEGWEKYEPLAGACIREAERLFAMRTVASRKAHKVMTPEEYALIPLLGWHEVCRDVDGCGGLGVRFLGLPHGGDSND